MNRLVVDDDLGSSAHLWAAVHEWSPGVVSFVSQLSSPNDLCIAMATMVPGHAYTATEQATNRHASALLMPAVQLSPRQKEVLTLVAMGKPNKAIARQLGISEHTVKSHVAALLCALGVRNRTEAAYRAAAFGV